MTIAAEEMTEYQLLQNISENTKDISTSLKELVELLSKKEKAKQEEESAIKEADRIKERTEKEQKALEEEPPILYNEHEVMIEPPYHDNLNVSSIYVLRKNRVYPYEVSSGAPLYDHVGIGDAVYLYNVAKGQWIKFDVVRKTNNSEGSNVYLVTSYIDYTTFPAFGGPNYANSNVRERLNTSVYSGFVLKDRIIGRSLSSDMYNDDESSIIGTYYSEDYCWLLSKKDIEIFEKYGYNKRKIRYDTANLAKNYILRDTVQCINTREVVPASIGDRKYKKGDQCNIVFGIVMR